METSKAHSSRITLKQIDSDGLILQQFFFPIQCFSPGSLQFYYIRSQAEHVGVAANPENQNNPISSLYVVNQHQQQRS